MSHLHTHPHHPSRAVFYRTLVTWQRVDNIVASAPQEERQETLELVMNCLDHAVMECVLHRLESDHHQTFLVLCHDRYHDEGLLEWLKEHVADIEDELKTVVDRTKDSIEQAVR